MFIKSGENGASNNDAFRTCYIGVAKGRLRELADPDPFIFLFEHTLRWTVKLFFYPWLSHHRQNCTIYDTFIVLLTTISVKKTDKKFFQSDPFHPTFLNILCKKFNGILAQLMHKMDNKYSLSCYRLWMRL